VELREVASAPALGPLFARAAVTQKGRGGELPNHALRLAGVEVDREHLAHYDHVCGFRVRDELPPTYPHMVAFPLAMKIMTDGSFPFPAMGMVHIENRIEQKRWLRADEKLDFRVRAANLREHERGLQFDIVADASAGGDPVWHSTNTYLRRTGGAGGGGSGAADKRPEPPAPDSIWSVPDDIGRRYASVSGDINPIHMHGLSARLFGFPKAIAHGMWLKARCLAALEGQLPPALSVEVAFKLPLLLPAKVGFASWEAGAGREFAVHDARSGKPHLTGSLQAASD
jgi:acyl dehydratase